MIDIVINTCGVALRLMPQDFVDDLLALLPVMTGCRQTIRSKLTKILVPINELNEEYGSFLKIYRFSSTGIKK